MRSTDGADGRWPALPLAEWQPTRDTLHMWTQVIGKVRMALVPKMNHWWHVTLYVNSRGLTTSLMPIDRGGLEITFDFADHVLRIESTDRRSVSVPLEPRSVADFYTETIARLRDIGVEVSMLARPVEVRESIPFADDHEHASYDRVSVERFWQALINAQRVLSEFRAVFIGKASPVHFFWGGFDLATTRFSGRPAPLHPGGVPNCADWVMHDAYSHEVSSCGYWPDGADEGVFYSYAYPEPDRFADWSMTVDGARYDGDLREFVLPYSAVRSAANPDEELTRFLQHTYEAAATLAQWPRASLERGRTPSPT